MNYEAAIQALSEMARKVLPAGGEAWLFGSQARGTANRDSDWDVLILIDGDRATPSDYSNYAHPFLELGWDIDLMIRPIILSKKQWERASFTPFYKNVMTDRIRL